MPDISVTGPAGSTVTHAVGGPRIRIGRDPENELVLRDPEVSRLHAELHCEDGVWYVLDHGSRNGTLIRGRPVKGVRVLKRCEDVAIGPYVLRICPEDGHGTRPCDTTADAAGGEGAGAGEPVAVGDSPAMRRVRELVGRVAALDVPVLVTGESGTGKELVASLLHRQSPRARFPFVVVNCPSLPASLADAELFGVERGVATGVDARTGRLELADKGTLFLDEIGDLEPTVQAKLLRFLEDGSLDGVGSRKPRRVDVRVVSATNQDLGSAVERGAFRADLYHRLAAARIHVPPLRERPEDIRPLVAHVLASIGAPDVDVAPEVLTLLESHGLPGNVRQLQHVIRLAHALSGDGRIAMDDLPDELKEHAARGRTSAEALLGTIVDGGASFWDVVKDPFMSRELGREDVEALVRLARERAGGSYRAMAELLGIAAEYRQLINFLNYHGIDREGRSRSGRRRGRRSGGGSGRDRPA